MSRVLVTGINGFVGHHLARELSDNGDVVLGCGLDAELDPTLNGQVSQYFGECDLTKPESVAGLPLETVDAVINLAGLAQVGASFGEGQAEKYNFVNVAVQTTIAERLRELGHLSTRVVAVSTGAVYDNFQPMPINEDGSLISKGSPYTLSKIAMEEALSEHRQNGLDVIVARPSNHIGPGQLGGFLVPDLIKGLRSLGPNKELLAGRLDTKRDYTDVRDVVRAYRLLATADKLDHNLYNICSGESHSGQEILGLLTELMGISGVKVVLDESRVRPNDPVDVRGDSSRLQTDTGWSPTIPLKQTLRDTLGL